MKNAIRARRLDESDLQRSHTGSYCRIRGSDSDGSKHEQEPRDATAQPEGLRLEQRPPNLLPPWLPAVSARPRRDQRTTDDSDSRRINGSGE